MNSKIEPRALWHADVTDGSLVYVDPTGGYMVFGRATLEAKGFGTDTRGLPRIDIRALRGAPRLA